MKYIFTTLVILLATFVSGFTQKQVDIKVWKPSLIQLVEYQIKPKTVINVLVKDNRNTSKVYSKEIVRNITKNLKVAFPEANVRIAESLRETSSSEPNKVFLILNITDYYAFIKGHSWIGKTGIKAFIFDTRDEKIKKYQQEIIDFATKPNRNGIESAKVALQNSYKGVNEKLMVYLHRVLQGKEKSVLVDKQEKEIQSNIKNTESNEEIEVSNIDVNIPVSEKLYKNRYALIVGNQDYKVCQPRLESDSNVDFAIRDAEIFREYAAKTLGIPIDNIIFLKNAKAVEFKKAVDKLNDVAKKLGEEGELYFYYAGYGFPNEKTSESYIMPIDVSDTDLKEAISLNELYKELTEHPLKRVTVILDACFNASGRNKELMDKSMKVTRKENVLKGNIVVFSASEGYRSSLTNKEYEHGLFTYYFLRKLKETKGDISYGEFAEYLTKEVSIKSVLVNNKEQNLQVVVSPVIKDSWAQWRFIQ